MESSLCLRSRHSDSNIKGYIVDDNQSSNAKIEEPVDVRTQS
jgi:hypothetical protein